MSDRGGKVIRWGRRSRSPRIVSASFYVERAGVRAWVRQGVRLAELAPPDGDPDRLLARPDCQLIKDQRKIRVGRLRLEIGGTAQGVFVKRYNAFTWRVRVASLFAPSGAFAAWRGASLLARHGFLTPRPLAAVEMRRRGVVEKSFFMTREVEGAVTADQYWWSLRKEPDPSRRRARRRALVATLAGLFRDLHIVGLYHPDLKDANLLVVGPDLDAASSLGGEAAPDVYLLDLERVRGPGRVSRRRRVKNLVQLDRTLGRAASRTERLRFLRYYLGREGDDPKVRRYWVRRVLWARRRKEWWRTWRRRLRELTGRSDGGNAPAVGVAVGGARAGGGPTGAARQRISCIVVCQDEEHDIRECLESVKWCDEIVVVDGGSRDATPAICREYTARVIYNPWPGYRAQKQFALEQAREPWVLNLDADERVSPALREEIIGVLRAPPPGVDGFEIPRLVYYLGRWWYRGDWYPGRVVRLVRREAACWGGVDPHDRVEVRGAIGRLRNPILHYTYRDISDHLRSANHLTGVAARARPASRVRLEHLLLRPLWRFLRFYVVHRAFLEGTAGLFAAQTAAFYVFLRWAKGWEKNACGRGRVG